MFKACYQYIYIYIYIYIYCHHYNTMVNYCLGCRKHTYNVASPESNNDK